MWILIIDISSNNHYLHFSDVCFHLQLPSTKILVTGMFLKVQALWVVLWPVEELNLIWRNTWILIIDISSNNHYLHLRMGCFTMRLPSTNFMAIVVLRVQALWVVLWPVEELNLIWYNTWIFIIVVLSNNHCLLSEMVPWCSL